MSYTIHLAVKCELVRDLPDWMLTYLRGLAAVPPVERAPEIPEDHAWLAKYGDGELPNGQWFGSPFAVVQLDDVNSVSWIFRMQGSVHESAESWRYAFLKLLARWSTGGCIACSWTNDGASGVEVWYAHDGELFSGRGGERPKAINDERTQLPRQSWRYERPDGLELQAYGLDKRRADDLAAAGDDDPALARWLVARRLWRAAVEEVDYEYLGPEPSARQVAAAAVEQVLRALDHGRDPETLGDAPGWRLVEVTNGPTPPWPRPIEGLADHLGDLTPEAVAATPVRLEPGMRISAVTDFQLTAVSSETTTGPSGVSGKHSLQVLVPAGATLTITEVGEKGHARATSPAWTKWITDEQPGKLADEPRAPRSDANTYMLRVIRPLDAGSSWIVAGSSIS